MVSDHRIHQSPLVVAYKRFRDELRPHVSNFHLLHHITKPTTAHWSVNSPTTSSVSPPPKLGTQDTHTGIKKHTLLVLHGAKQKKTGRGGVLLPAIVTVEGSLFPPRGRSALFVRVIPFFSSRRAFSFFSIPKMAEVLAPRTRALAAHRPSLL
jgi:hypothetical protein